MEFPSVRRRTKKRETTTIEQQSDIVILLHGIGRTGRAMASIGRALQREGFASLAISYPWRRREIAGLAEFVGEVLVREAVWERFRRVHFVTHSMGGLVAARYLAQHPIDDERLGRVVMLGPPNGGSEVADLLCRLPPYRWFYGPAGQELTTLASNAALALPAETGIIAGSRGWPYALGMLTIRGPHDGRVAVARTRRTGMADHIVLPATHTFLPSNGTAHRQAAHFLRHGRFER